MDFLEDRKDLLGRLAETLAVPEGSCEWNRGPWSNPKAPKALRRRGEDELCVLMPMREASLLHDPKQHVHANPFANDGKCMWQWALTTAHSLTQYVEPSEIMPSIPWGRRNESWECTLNDMVPRMDGESVMRPEGKWVFDFASHPNGWDLMKKAHGFTHGMVENGLRGGIMRKEILEPRGMAMLFAQECARVALSVKMGLPRTSETRVLFCVTNGPKRYWRIPLEQLPVPGSWCVVFAFVRIEPHPKSMSFHDSSEKVKWLEVNRWCCSPCIVSFAGFLCPDVVLKCPVVKSQSGKSLFVAVPPEAMHPMGCFRSFVDLATMSESGIFNGMSLPGDLMPPWPCKSCMAMNMQVDGTPGRDDDEAAVKAFDGKVYEAIDKASEWYEAVRGSAMSLARKTRKRARSEWSHRMRDAMACANLTARARSWLVKGDPDKAARLMAAARVKSHG